MKTRQKIPVAKRVFYMPLVLILCLVVIGNLFIDLYFTRTAAHRYEADLLRLAQTGVNALSLLDETAQGIDFDAFADSFTRDQGFRVTLIDQNGGVLGDSKLSPEQVAVSENHGDRSEIIAAGKSGTGITRRYSSTLKSDLLYVAVAYETSGRQGFFRVALALTELKKEITRQRILFVMVGGGVLIGFSLISMVFSRYLLLLIQTNENQLEDRVKKRTKHIETLQTMGTQLTMCQSKEEGTEIIKQGALILLPKFQGALSLFRASKDKIEVCAAWNGNWIGDKSYAPSDCWAVRKSRPYTSCPDSGKMRCSHSKTHGKKVVCIPIAAQGENYGVLHFSCDPGYTWSREDHQLAYAIAESASLALANLELRENLKHQAIRDPLTGLFNRRYLLETFQSELSRAARRRQVLGVLMLDLDHFKQFNDQYGHDFGDFILSELGRLIRLITRDEDIPCRYGGEEFTIVLPETNKGALALVAEKIRHQIKTHDFIFKGQSLGPITISIGGALYPKHGNEIEVLLKIADTALYAAKADGRDQVVISS